LEGAAEEVEGALLGASLKKYNKRVKMLIISSSRGTTRRHERERDFKLPLSNYTK